jgi:FdhD protein
MNEQTEKFSILKVSREGKSRVIEEVARELPVTIILNDQELVTMLATPESLDSLAVGFLVSEGIILGKDEIKNVLVDDIRGVVRVETAESKELAPDILFKRIISSGCGRGASFYSAADTVIQKVESRTKISAEEIFTLVYGFQHTSKLYLTTHGVHSAALCDLKDIIVFFEDIGRHNAIDKIFGKCLIEDIPTDGRILITSGRVSSEILHKIAKRAIPIIISVSTPTNLGVKIAGDLGITLIGSVKGGKINVYTNDWRIS